MEGIIKKRHPNSLPVLMWAAANAVSTSGGGKPASVTFLEERIKKLEQEADYKDEEAKRSIRVLEQKYNAMKVQLRSHSGVTVRSLFVDKLFNPPFQILKI